MGPVVKRTTSLKNHSAPLNFGLGDPPEAGEGSDEVAIDYSGTIAARGLKFWLQVALSAPIATAWAEIRKSGSGKSGFSGIFFSLFSLLRTSWDLRVDPGWSGIT